MPRDPCPEQSIAEPVPWRMPGRKSPGVGRPICALYMVRPSRRLFGSLFHNNMARTVSRHEASLQPRASAIHRERSRSTTREMWPPHRHHTPATATSHLGTFAWLSKPSIQRAKICWNSENCSSSCGQGASTHSMLNMVCGPRTRGMSARFTSFPIRLREYLRCPCLRARGGWRCARRWREGTIGAQRRRWRWRSARPSPSLLPEEAAEASLLQLLAVAEPTQAR